MAAARAIAHAGARAAGDAPRPITDASTGISWTCPLPFRGSRHGRARADADHHGGRLTRPTDADRRPRATTPPPSADPARTVNFGCVIVSLLIAEAYNLPAPRLPVDAIADFQTTHQGIMGKWGVS